MDKNLKISIIAIAFLSAQADDLNLDKTQLDINKNHTTQHVNLDEIIVSANKMDERLKDVAQSISVLSGIEIQERRIQNIQDVIRQIPNMNFTTFVSKTLVNFRGINHSNFTNSNPVAIYFDGIATTNHYGFYNSRFNNVERIEVLRGPQTALYGKETIGGVINIVSRMPDNKWSGDIGMEYGSYSKFNSNLNLGGALIDDKLFLNLGASFMSDDGWIKNDFNDDKKAAKNSENRFDISLISKPTDRLLMRLNLAKEKAKENFFRGGEGKFGTIKRKDAKHANFDMPTFTNSKALSQVLSIEYEFDKAKFSSVSTHKSSIVNGIYDLDYSNMPNNNGLSQFQDVKNETMTQEFRLSGLNSEKFKWIGGIYFEDEKTINKKMGMDLFLNPATNKLETMNAPATMKGRTMAIFGQGDYELIDNLRFILAGRYQKIDKKIDQKMIFSMQDIPNGMVDFQYNDKKTWTKFLPKVGLNLAINDQINLFTSYSRGYLAGGHNFFATSGTPDQNRFGPQISDNYELGLYETKTNLRYGATLFYMNIKDIHMYKSLPNGVYFVSNAGKANSHGLEFEISYYADNGLDLSASLGVNKTKYRQNETKGAKGKKIENTPEFNANLGIGYTHSSGIYARADIHGVGTTCYDSLNQNRQKAYAIANLHAGYRTDNFDVYAYVLNATNTNYTNGYMVHGGQYDMISFGEPRRVGVGVKYSF